jgi:hypothetical protein
MLLRLFWKGRNVCRTCARLRARPRFGVLALLAIIALSTVPIVCGLVLLTLQAPRSPAMTLLYTGGGLVFMTAMAGRCPITENKQSSPLRPAATGSPPPAAKNTLNTSFPRTLCENGQPI